MPGACAVAIEIAVVVVSAVPAGASQRPAPSIESVVERRLSSGGSGDGTVLVVDHAGAGPAVYAWNLPGTSAPVSADDLYPVPGMTEVLLAAAVRSLHAGGSVDVSAPIGETLLELPESLRPITLHQLLTHTAGLDDARLPDDATMAEVLDSIPEASLFTEPGAVYSYSRYSYPLAARVLERAFGLPLGDILARSFLEPLGMARSTFDLARATELGLAVGYDSTDRREPEAPPQVVPVEPVARIGGLPILYTSATDLLRFVTAWRDGAIRGSGPDALPERPALPRVADPRSDGFERIRHGLYEGFAVSSRRLGFTSELRLFPSAGLAVVSWANTVVGGLGRLPDEATDFVQERLLGPDVPVTVRGGESPSVAPEDESPRSLTDWVGSYFNGDELVILRTPETEVDAEVVFFDGMRELPVRRTEPGSDDLIAVLPGDGRVAVRFHVFVDTAGRAYVYLREKAFRRPLEHPRPGGIRR